MDDPKVDPEGQGQRSRSPGQKKRDFRPHLKDLHVILEVKGHMGQGQMSCRSGSMVKVKNVIFCTIPNKNHQKAGGLTSMSCCIFSCRT